MSLRSPCWRRAPWSLRTPAAEPAPASGWRCALAGACHHRCAAASRRRSCKCTITAMRSRTVREHSPLERVKRMIGPACESGGCELPALHLRRGSADRPPAKAHAQEEGLPKPRRSMFACRKRMQAVRTQSFSSLTLAAGAHTIILYSHLAHACVVPQSPLHAPLVRRRGPKFRRAYAGPIATRLAYVRFSVRTIAYGSKCS